MLSHLRHSGRVRLLWFDTEISLCIILMSTQKSNSIIEMTLNLLFHNQTNKIEWILLIFPLATSHHLIEGKEKYEIKRLDDSEVIYLETLSKRKLYHE